MVLQLPMVLQMLVCRNPGLQPSRAASASACCCIGTGYMLEAGRARMSSRTPMSGADAVSDSEFAGRLSARSRRRGDTSHRRGGRRRDAEQKGIALGERGRQGNFNPCSWPHSSCPRPSAPVGAAQAAAHYCASSYCMMVSDCTQTDNQFVRSDFWPDCSKAGPHERCAEAGAITRIAISPSCPAWNHRRNRSNCLRRSILRTQAGCPCIAGEQPDCPGSASP